MLLQASLTYPFVTHIICLLWIAADPKPGGGIPEAEDWRVAFEEAGTRSSFPSSPSRSSRDARAPSPSMSGRASSRNSNHSDGDENGDVGSSRRTPVRRAPPPPPGSTYRY